MSRDDSPPHDNGKSQRDDQCDFIHGWGFLRFNPRGFATAIASTIVTGLLIGIGADSITLLGPRTSWQYVVLIVLLLCIGYELTEANSILRGILEELKKRQ